MSNKNEQIILKNLVKNKTYAEQIIPFIQKEEWFQVFENRHLFRLIKEYYLSYHESPCFDALHLMVKDITGLKEDEHQEIFKQAELIFQGEKNENLPWLLSETERYIKDRVLFLGALEAIDIIDGKTTTGKTSIVGIFEDALAVSLDVRLGHDYFEDAISRFNFLTSPQNKIPFNIEDMNKATNGGVKRKTFNVIGAPPNTGKSAMLCHLAASYLKDGLNVLYISMEMSEEQIAERIDANLLDVKIDDINKMSLTKFEQKLAEVKSFTKGKLVVKEYPMGCASVINFKHIISELKTKKNFVADVIVIDYLNLCASSKAKVGSPGGSYHYVKSIGEELRAMATQEDVVLWSATQINRVGAKEGDFSQEDVADSYGTAMTADLLWGIISDDDLAAQGLVRLKQLKNRHNAKTNLKTFLLSVDFAKSKFWDAPEDVKKIENSSPEITTENEKEDRSDVMKQKTANWVVS